MKSHLRVLALATGVFCAVTGFAQTTVPATKASASASASTASAAKSPASPGAKSASSTSAGKTAMPTTAAVGGGDGKVWVNTKSKTYHCDGTKYYGKTKVGEYMTEADAKAKGNHADHGKTCAK